MLADFEANPGFGEFPGKIPVETPASDPNGTCLSAFVREQGACIIKAATRSPYEAQRNAGESLTILPIPGFRYAASRLHTVVVAQSGLK